MVAPEPDTDELIAQASRGVDHARQQLLARHRGRLRRMVAVHLDRRLAARIDPSDVVQDALAEATRKLSGYLRDRPMPFYPWLRQLAWERLVKLHHRHLRTQRRSITREQPGVLDLPDESALELAHKLIASGTSPSKNLLREELPDPHRSRIRQECGGSCSRAFMAENRGPPPLVAVAAGSAAEWRRRRQRGGGQSGS